jgi:hypothetical protein
VRTPGGLFAGKEGGMRFGNGRCGDLQVLGLLG